MQRTKYIILSTKKLQASVVEQAKKNNIEITEHGFISVKPLWSAETRNKIEQWLTSDIQFTVFTSANAAEIAIFYWREIGKYCDKKLSIFCLSGKTESLISSFIGNIIDSADNATELANRIIEKDVKEITFFCGTKRRDELPDILKNTGVIVHEIITYETTATPISAGVSYDGILFFSPSAVDSFFSLNQIDKNVVCFAIG